MKLKTMFTTCVTKYHAAFTSLFSHHETDPEMPAEEPAQAIEPAEPEDHIEQQRLYELIPEMRNVNTDQLFENTREGDILFAVIPCTMDQLASMKYNRRRKLYLIAEKLDDGVLAYPCSTYHSSSEKQMYFEPADENYRLKEGTRILLNKAEHIPKTHLSNYLDHLSASDQLRINVILNMTGKSAKTHPRIRNSLKILPNTVVYKGNEHYYVCSLEENQALVFPLTELRKGVPVNFNGSLRYVDVEHGRQIEIDDTCSCAGALASSARNDILHACRNHAGRFAVV